MRSFTPVHRGAPRVEEISNMDPLLLILIIILIIVLLSGGGYYYRGRW